MQRRAHRPSLAWLSRSFLGPEDAGPGMVTHYGVNDYRQYFSFILQSTCRYDQHYPCIKLTSCYLRTPQWSRFGGNACGLSLNTTELFLTPLRT